jgi:hypothetical protein
MKHVSHRGLPKLFILFLAILGSCVLDATTEISYQDLSLQDIYETGGNGVFYPETSDYVNLEYTLDIGTSIRDV